MKTIKSIIAFLFVLLTAQAALAWYDPSTQRWLSRDPIGEPGFQVLQAATQVMLQPKGSIVSTSSRWINRDPIEGGINLHIFISNDPINQRDLWGLEVDGIPQPIDPYLPPKSDDPCKAACRQKCHNSYDEDSELCDSLPPRQRSNCYKAILKSLQFCIRRCNGGWFGPTPPN